MAEHQTECGTHLSLCDHPGRTLAKTALPLLGSRTPLHISEVQVHLSQDPLADSALLPSRHLCDVAQIRCNQHTSQFALMHTQGLEYVIIAVSCLSQNSVIFTHWILELQWTAMSAMILRMKEEQMSHGWISLSLNMVNGSSILLNPASHAHFFLLP